MRAKFLLVPLAILGLLSLSVGQSNDPELVEGRVIFVTDGDEIRVKTVDGRVFTVRLHGLDAPEKDQHYGAAARKELESRSLDKEARIVIHRRDSQGRYMGTVFVEGQDIGVRMLENGSAWHYKRLSGEQSSETRARYAKAELKARESGVGLWAAATPMPPWEFREGTGQVEKAGSSPGSETRSLSGSALPAEPSQKPVVSLPGAALPDDESGRKYVLGPRGGCYYLNSSGGKVYVKDKSRCTKP